MKKRAIMISMLLVMALSVTGCSQKTATKNDDTKTLRAARQCAARSQIPGLRVLSVPGAIPLYRLLSETGTGETGRGAGTRKGGTLVDFSYRRKAERGADYRRRAWH